MNAGVDALRLLTRSDVDHVHGVHALVGGADHDGQDDIDDKNRHDTTESNLCATAPTIVVPVACWVVEDGAVGRGFELAVEG